MTPPEEQDNVMDLKLVKITQHNLEIFDNLAQAYEAEFSSLTGKMPNEKGLFKVDAPPFCPYCGYLLIHQAIPIGFVVIDVQSDIKDVAEFYVIPSMRKKGAGYHVASMIFNKYPGHWKIRQIEGAFNAVNFSAQYR